MNKLSISKQLIKLRESHKLTQRQLGEKLGVSESTINTWESGRRSPAPAAREKICKFFHIDMNHLYGINESNNNVIKIEYFDHKYVFPADYFYMGNNLFDYKHKIADIYLPKSMLADDKEYFAIKATGTNLKSHDILEDDVLVFAFRERHYIQSKKIACCLVDKKVRTMLYNKTSKTEYLLTDDKNEYNLDNNNVGCGVFGQLITIIRRQD